MDREVLSYLRSEWKACGRMEQGADFHSNSFQELRKFWISHSSSPCAKSLIWKGKGAPSISRLRRRLGRNESHAQELKVSEVIIVDYFGLSAAKFSTASHVFPCLDIAANLLFCWEQNIFYLVLLFYRTETITSAKMYMI